MAGEECVGHDSSTTGWTVQEAIFDPNGDDMPDLNPQPLPPRDAIRVHMPPELLYDLEAFQRVQASVLDRLGCGGCTSGHQFLFQAFEEFVVNKAGEVRPMAGGEVVG